VKYLLIAILSSFSLAALARPSEALRCLGVEEHAIHKAKSQGPDYQLNQQLISELVQVQNVDLKPEVLQDICKGKGNAASRKLLFLLLDKGPTIFTHSTGLNTLEKTTADSMLDDFMIAVQQIYLGYIASIQQEAPTADCLKKNIPELELFYTDIKYLEEEVETKYLFKDKGLAEKIMKKLSNYPALLKSCQPQKVKKTDKSLSKPALKKS